MAWPSDSWGRTSTIEVKAIRILAAPDRFQALAQVAVTGDVTAQQHKACGATTEP